MRTILLILTDVGTPASVVNSAIGRADKNDHELIVLSILDPEAPAKMAGRLLDTGTMGARPSEEVLDSLNHRHEVLALERAEEVVTEAIGRGVKARSEIHHGNFAREITRLVTALRPDVVVVEKRRRALLRLRTDKGVLDKLAETLGFELLEV